VLWQSSTGGEGSYKVPPASEVIGACMASSPSWEPLQQRATEPVAGTALTPEPLRRNASPPANLRVFLDKLGRRRKTVRCTARCRRIILSSLRQLGGKQLLATGRLSHSQLKEVLRSPPAGVPTSTLRELVDVARAYDGLGDGCVDLEELIDGALQIEPGLCSRFRLVLPLTALLVWPFIGSAVYCSVSGWSFLDGIYFSIMTLSTVGAGGGLSSSGTTYPETEGLKVFTAIYLLVGIGLVTWSFVALLTSALLAHESRLWSLLSPRDNADLLADDGLGMQSSGPALEELFCSSSPLPAVVGAASLVRSSAVASGDGDGDASTSLAASSKQRRSCLQQQTALLRTWMAARAWELSLAACLLIVLVLILIGTLLGIYTSSEASFADALCWAVLTCLTAGYGEMTPAIGDDLETDVGRGLTMGFVLLAVSGVVGVLLKIGSLCLQVRTAKLEARLEARCLPLDLLIDLDANDVGVSRLEFVCAALMASDRVSAHDLWRLLELFRRLDSSRTGFLRQSDLGRLCREGHPGESNSLNLTAASASLAPALAALDLGYSNFGSVSDVSPPFDRTSALSLDGRGRSVRFDGASNSEVQELHAEPVSAEQLVQNDQADQWLEARLSPLVDELYHDAVTVRRQLDEKDSEVLAVLHAKGVSEQALSQALAERQGLHGEVVLLQQIQTELESKVQEEKRKRATAESKAQELQQRIFDLEGKLQDTERARREAERKLKGKSENLAEALDKTRTSERRAQDAEQSAADCGSILQEQQQKLSLQSEARVNEVKLMCAEVDMQRQGELRMALLELQALSQGQHALRSDVKSRMQPIAIPTGTIPTGNSSLYNYNASLNDSCGSTVPLRIRSGQQPWEVWERSSSNLNRGAENAFAESGAGGYSSLLHSKPAFLLSGKVQQQAEFLDTQARHFEERRRDHNG